MTAEQLEQELARLAAWVTRHEQERHDLVAPEQDALHLQLVDLTSQVAWLRHEIAVMHANPHFRLTELRALGRDLRQLHAVGENLAQAAGAILPEHAIGQ